MTRVIKISSTLLFFVWMCFLPSVAQAAAANCPHYQSGVDCVDDYLMGGKCIAKVTAESWYDFCKSLDPNKALNCAVSSKVCVCGPGYEPNPNIINTCRAICPSGQLYCGASTVCQAKNYGTCAAQGMSVADYCTGACSSCSPGYVNYKGKCKLAISVIYDEGLSAFFGYVSPSWLEIGPWKMIGTNITFNPGKVGINLPDPGVYTLNVNGDTNITGNLNVTKNTTVGGDVTVEGNTYLKKNLTVDGDTNLKNLKVTNNATFNNITITGETSGMIGKFVGFSPSSNYNGNQSGYKTANTICANAYPSIPASPGAGHICNAQEIINTSVNGSFGSASGDAWINNGPPGYVKYATNDCTGWTGTSTTNFGAIFDFTNKYFMPTPCNKLRKFACCK